MSHNPIFEHKIIKLWHVQNKILHFHHFREPPKPFQELPSYPDEKKRGIKKDRPPQLSSTFTKRTVGLNDLSYRWTCKFPAEVETRIEKQRRVELSAAARFRPGVDFSFKY